MAVTNVMEIHRAAFRIGRVRLGGMSLVLLLASMSFANAADGDFDAELRNVESRYRELLVSLRAKAVAGADQQTVAKIDARLKDSPAPPASDAVVHPSLPTLNSKFVGTLRTGAGEKQRVTATVTKSGDDAFSVRCEMDSGAIWLWNFKLERGGEIEVVDFVRIRTMKKVKQGPGTGAVRGGGEWKDGKLSWQFSWPTNDDTFRGKYDLEPQG